MLDTKLEALKASAQEAANRDGSPMVILNLNGVGKRLLVIRGADCLAPGESPYAGPFNPETGA